MTSGDVTLSYEAAVRSIPSHAELERAITSVPGVDEAHVALNPETGRSRLRIRLISGQDAPAVSAAIAATLRERFGIKLDAEAIRPRIAAPDDTAPADRAEDEPDDLEPGSVVVVGDRVSLSDAARAVLAEAAGTDPHPGSTEAAVAEEPRVAEEPDDLEGPPDEIAEELVDVLTTLAEDEGDAPGPLRLVTEGASFPGAAPTPDEAADEAPSGSDDRPETDRPDEGGDHRAWRIVAGEAEPDRRSVGRAAIRNLDTHIDISDIRVTATLSHRGRTVTGEAHSVPTRQGILRAVATATADALRELTGDRLVVSVDAVHVSVSGEPPLATVTAGVVTERGEETLIGASLVRDDPERAVMRATLDALNRRVERWLEVDLAG